MIHLPRPNAPRKPAAVPLAALVPEAPPGLELRGYAPIDTLDPAELARIARRMTR